MDQTILTTRKQRLNPTRRIEKQHHHCMAARKVPNRQTTNDNYFDFDVLFSTSSVATTHITTVAAKYTADPKPQTLGLTRQR